MGGRGGGAGGSGAAGRGNNVNSGVPAAARKVVQSLKEVVNCSEQEIYVMLVECDMDPDEAVNRLLSQDTFHEVKSKRDKKKETKDTTDSRPRGAVNNPNRGARGGIDRYAGRGGANQFSSNESGSLLGKPANKGENGTRMHMGGSSCAAGVIGRQFPFHSDPKGAENKRVPMSSGDAVPSSSQASSGYQPAWLGAPGQRSMAEIVKMGRPLHHNIVSPLSSEPFNSSKEAALTTTGQKAPFKDEWPSIEKPEATYASSVLKGSAESKLCSDPFSEPAGRPDHHLKSQLHEDPVTENLPVESPVGDQVRPPSVSSRNLHDDDSGGSSLYEDNNYENVDSYQTQRHPFEHNGADDVTSSVATNFQRLSIENDDQEALVEEDKPAVIIPNHLQVHTSDCLHLRFGSFGSGTGSGLPSTSPSGPLNDSLEEIPEVAEDSSIRHPDTRDAEFYGDDEPLRYAADGNMAYQIDSSARNYESSSDSETEPSKEETLEAVQENQYNFSSGPEYDIENRQQNYAFETSQQNYAFENSQHLNPPSAPKETAPQMQNMDAFPGVMQQAYTNSLPSSLLPSTIQDAREPDLQYSPFPVTESMPAKFSVAATSLTGPAISMAEALRAASISTPPPAQQTMPSAATAAGPAALAQHLAMHPYSQPTLPLGHYANMISYPFLPQSYTYMPSAFQQAFAGNSTYHQSLAAMLPQYKNNNLPQSASVPSAYGFGSNSSNLPGGSFPLNPSSAANSTISYDDVLNSQFKDNNHLASLQQNENSAAWLQGPNSRMLSGMPGSTYYSFPGQNQQPPGFRQGQQQPSQHFGALGYANLYHSQAGISLDHHHLHHHHHLQQQNPRDAALQQGHPAKQTQQLWQNSY